MKLFVNYLVEGSGHKKLLDSFDKASLIVSVNDKIAASDQSTTTVSLLISQKD